MTEEPSSPDARVLADVPQNHGISATDRIEVQPGSTERVGNVDISCPAGGAACVLSVAHDGTVSYQTTGGMPSIGSADTVLAGVPANHGIAPQVGIELRPGSSERLGNVEVNCPVRGPFCILVVAADGTVSYKATGGMPSIVSAEMALAGIPANHGIAPQVGIEIQPGSTERFGNVEISCPAGGPACVVSVARGDRIAYALTGGVPDIRPATMVVTGVPSDHGIAVMDGIEVEAGDISRVGDVYVSCPGSGPACVLDVGQDGSVAYRLNGGMPAISPIFVEWPLPSTATDGLDANALIDFVYRHSGKTGVVNVTCCSGWERVTLPQSPFAEMPDIRFYEWSYWNAPGLSADIVKIQKRIKIEDIVNLNERTVYGVLDHAVIWVADNGDVLDDPQSPFGAGVYYYEAVGGDLRLNDRPDIYNINARWEGDALAIGKEARKVIVGQSVVTFDTVDFPDVGELYFGYVIQVDLEFNDGYNISMKGNGADQGFSGTIYSHPGFCDAPGYCTPDANTDGLWEAYHGDQAYRVHGFLVGPNGEEVVGQFESDTHFGSFGADRVP